MSRRGKRRNQEDFEDFLRPQAKKTKSVKPITAGLAAGARNKGLRPMAVYKKFLNALSKAKGIPTEANHDLTAMQWVDWLWSSGEGTRTGDESYLVGQLETLRAGTNKSRVPVILGKSAAGTIHEKIMLDIHPSDIYESWTGKEYFKAKVVGDIRSGLRTLKRHDMSAHDTSGEFSKATAQERALFGGATRIRDDEAIGCAKNASVLEIAAMIVSLSGRYKGARDYFADTEGKRNWDENQVGLYNAQMRRINQLESILLSRPNGKIYHKFLMAKARQNLAKLYLEDMTQERVKEIVGVLNEVKEKPDYASASAKLTTIKTNLTSGSKDSERVSFQNLAEELMSMVRKRCPIIYCTGGVPEICKSLCWIARTLRDLPYRQEIFFDLPPITWQFLDEGDDDLSSKEVCLKVLQKFLGTYKPVAGKEAEFYGYLIVSIAPSLYFDKELYIRKCFGVSGLAVKLETILSKDFDFYTCCQRLSDNPITDSSITMPKVHSSTFSGLHLEEIDAFDKLVAYSWGGVGERSKKGEESSARKEFLVEEEKSEELSKSDYNPGEYLKSLGNPSGTKTLVERFQEADLEAPKEKPKTTTYDSGETPMDSDDSSKKKKGGTPKTGFTEKHPPKWQRFDYDPSARESELQGYEQGEYMTWEDGAATVRLTQDPDQIFQYCQKMLDERFTGSDTFLSLLWELLADLNRLRQRLLEEARRKREETPFTKESPFIKMTSTEMETAVVNPPAGGFQHWVKTAGGKAWPAFLPPNVAPGPIAQDLAPVLTWLTKHQFLNHGNTWALHVYDKTFFFTTQALGGLIIGFANNMTDTFKAFDEWVSAALEGTWFPAIFNQFSYDYPEGMTREIDPKSKRGKVVLPTDIISQKPSGWTPPSPSEVPTRYMRDPLKYQFVGESM